MFTLIYRLGNKFSASFWGTSWRNCCWRWSKQSQWIMFQIYCQCWKIFWSILEMCLSWNWRQCNFSLCFNLQLCCLRNWSFRLSKWIFLLETIQNNLKRILKLKKLKNVVPLNFSHFDPKWPLLAANGQFKKTAMS